MTDLTNADRLILAFEHMPPGSALRINDVIRLIESLGGNAKAVQNCQHEISLMAYISALTVRYIEESRPAIHHRIRFPTNAGHGHVFPRPDGVRMRCGGPGICDACNIDASEKIGG